MIRILDIVTCIGVLTTLNLVGKYNKAWIAYAIVSLVFAGVMASKGLPGQTVMGIALAFTGFRNYLRGKK